ncbi:MAG: ribonuclease R, partial [Rhodospirillales bacterium]|nr:ribonuclease R [Rhodospirillales bacterium]
MAENRKPSAPFPTREAVLEFINEKPGHVGKREIARAFNLDAEQKRELKKLLRELTIDGSLQRRRGRKYADVGTLPEVSVLNISRLDQHGDLMANPTPWPDDVPPPRIYMSPERKGQPALGIGDRVLARLTKLNDLEYKAKTIRRLASAPAKVLGVYHLGSDGGRLRPTDKRQKSEFIVPDDYDLGVRQGELVMAEVIRGKHLGLRQVKIVERLGHADGQTNISAIAVHENGIPDTFSEESLVDADGAD